MENLHEKKLHGQLTFPYTVYRGKLPEYIRSYPLHWHEEMELIYVVEGQGIVTVQAERYTVRPGDILLIPPQTVHGIEQQDDRSMEYYNILFRLSLLEDGETGMNKSVQSIYDQSRMVSAFHPEGDDLNDKLRGPVLELIENRKRTDSAYPLMIRSQLYAIAYHIVCSSEGTGETGSRYRGNYENLKKVLVFLREHYAEPVTVHQGASICGFSDSHFMKLFRELTGISFNQYVKRLRLEAAEALLRAESAQIGEIAEAVGFHNLSYFTRAFERQYGCSPSAYRGKFR